MEADLDRVTISGVHGRSLRLDLDTGQLVPADEGEFPVPGLRRVHELADVLADPDASAVDPHRIAYLLYRDVRFPGDDAVRAMAIRCDVTVLLPGRFGTERPKTAGHVHGLAPDGVAYPEIYEVLHGSAAFVLQSSDHLIVALCHAGEKIVVPPGAGHLTVNLGPVPLAVLDLVAVSCPNDYTAFRENRGAAAYLVPDAESGFQFQPNPRYHPPYHTRIMHGSVWPPELFDGPSTTLAAIAPANLQFLLTPASQADQLRDLWSDRQLTSVLPSQ